MSSCTCARPAQCLRNVKGPRFGAPSETLAWLIGRLGAESGDDVGEDVPDLVAHRKKDDDDHDRDENQDQGVFDHTLTFLPAQKTAKLEVQAQHAFHLLFL